MWMLNVLTHGLNLYTNYLNPPHLSWRKNWIIFFTTGAFNCCSKTCSRMGKFQIIHKNHYFLFFLVWHLKKIRYIIIFCVCVCFHLSAFWQEKVLLYQAVRPQYTFGLHVQGNVGQNPSPFSCQISQIDK